MRCFNHVGLCQSQNKSQNKSVKKTSHGWNTSLIVFLCYVSFNKLELMLNNVALAFTTSGLIMLFAPFLTPSELVTTKLLKNLSCYWMYTQQTRRIGETFQLRWSSSVTKLHHFIECCSMHDTLPQHYTSTYHGMAIMVDNMAIIRMVDTSHRCRRSHSYIMGQPHL